MLIVFEGIDGTGKGTQIELLNENMEFITFKYPTRNTPELNNYLEKRIEIDRKTLFGLFLTDIMKEQKKITEELEKGKTVVLDRYVFSTIAYEFDAYSYEEAKKTVESMNFLKPDLVILLDIDGRASHERKKKQKQLDRYEEDVDYLEKVRMRFLELARDKFLTPNWHNIDATRSVEDIHKDILNVLKK